MSTIRVDNFGPSAGGTTYSSRGIAKAWVNLNGSGTIAARDSENVSSITDINTGLYSATFTNSMSDGQYQINVTSGGTSGATGDSTFGIIGDASPSTTTVTFMARDNNGNRFDAIYMHTAINGDLA